MPPTPSVPDVLRGRVFRGTWAVRAGLLTPAQVRSSAWRSLRRDVHVDATVPVDHHVRARGVSLVMPSAAAMGGLTAAHLWGATGLPEGDAPVEVVVPPGTRWQPGPGVSVRTAPLVGDVVHRDEWLRWTSRVRTAVDLVRRTGTGLDGSVVLLDQLVAARVVDLAAVRAAVAELPICTARTSSWRGWPQRSPRDHRWSSAPSRAELPQPTSADHRRGAARRGVVRRGRGVGKGRGEGWRRYRGRGRLPARDEEPRRR